MGPISNLLKMFWDLERFLFSGPFILGLDRDINGLEHLQWPRLKLRRGHLPEDRLQNHFPTSSLVTRIFAEVCPYLARMSAYRKLASLQLPSGSPSPHQLLPALHRCPPLRWLIASRERELFGGRRGIAWCRIGESGRSKEF